MKWLVALLITIALSWAALAQDNPTGDPPVDSRLKLEFDHLSARASAGIDTVNSMQERARASGETLHPDLLVQRNLVQSSMDAAQEALRASDNARLRERLKRARVHIDRLYTMI